MLKVVIFPFVAFGHMMPFYQLALALAKSGVRVYYISTPRNIQRLPKVPLNLSPLLDLVPIPFPKIPNSPLPADAEATVDISVEIKHHFIHLLLAFDLLQQPLKEFLAGVSPDWLIADFLSHWAADVAEECGVPLLYFSVFSSATLAFYGPPENRTGGAWRKVRSSPEDLTSPPPWVKFPSQVAFRPFEAAGFFNSYCAEGGKLGERLPKLLQESKAIAIRTCREIEGEYLTLLAELIGKPVIPVGFLPPELAKQREFFDENWSKIFNWLDEQRPKSVVFVGFGSECSLNKEQVAEIANGLAGSELPFLWVLGKPSWADDGSDALPAGFLSRTDAGKGKLCFGWSPQLEILAHPAIGGTLFHGGWGSMIETIQFGHAMVVLPFVYDQGLNARLLVEKGLAIEVARNEEDGSFTGKDIAKCLKQAMSPENGTERVRELAVVAGDRELHDDYFDEFVKYLTGA